MITTRRIILYAYIITIVLFLAQNLPLSLLKFLITSRDEIKADNILSRTKTRQASVTGKLGYLKSTRELWAKARARGKRIMWHTTVTHCNSERRAMEPFQKGLAKALWLNSQLLSFFCSLLQFLRWNFFPILICKSLIACDNILLPNRY